MKPRLPVHEIYRPRNDRKPADKVVVSILGFNSSWRTVRPRLHILADTLHAEVIGIVRRGTDATRIDPALRHKLGNQEQFLQACWEDSQWLNNRLFDYRQRVFEGSSAGAAVALGMVATQPGLATHALVREGYNHKARPGSPEHFVQGAFRMIRDQMPDVPLLDYRKPPQWRPSNPELQDNRPASKKLRSAAHLALTGCVEMWHWGPPACSDIAQQLARRVVETQPNVALYSVEYEHGIGGDVAQSRRFAEELMDIRSRGAAVEAVVVPDLRHSHLLDPQRHSKDIEHTLALR